MSKQVNLGKVFSLFEKADLDTQIEAYNKLGEKIHENISKAQQAMGDKLNDLQAKKEAIKKQ